MGRLEEKRNNTERRKNRVRSVVQGTSDRPRLSVHISNKNVSAQIIDDQKHVTILAVSSLNNKEAKGTMTEKAAVLGKSIAKQAKSKKISQVSFDRGSKLFHGRVKAFADAAREEGLKF